MEAEDLIIAQLQEIIARQAAQIDLLGVEVRSLRAENAALAQENARLRKNSSNSSKPPSSDIVKPPRPKGKGRRGKRRRIGGQPGHIRHERQPFGPDEIDDIQDHHLQECPHCGGRVEPSDEAPRVVQQVELPRKPMEVTEYRAHAVWCPQCQQTHWARLPAEVRAGGLVGPRLSALIAYLKGRCHASYSTIRTYLRDVLGLKISRGQLVRIVDRATKAMEDAYNELRSHLPSQEHLNVDETGHKDSGRRLWTWCFRAALYTLFHISPSRGSQVLVEMLGEEFDGVLGCDYFSAYRKYMGEFDVAVQFCLAHLIREVKFLVESPDKAAASYGRRLLKGLRRLFHTIHRREAMTPAGFQRSLEQARKALLATALRAPAHRQARNLARRFRRHGRQYFQFITTPGIEPTNNLAERAIRFVVMDRHVTQGTRGQRGQRWSERIWTAIATCAQQGRSVFDYLYQTILSHFRREPTPSLLPELHPGP